MGWRYLILIVTMLIRIFIGYEFTWDYVNNETIILSGNIYKRYQKDTKCFYEVGRFVAYKTISCPIDEESSVVIVGKVRRDLPRNILGKIVLEIQKIENDDTPISYKFEFEKLKLLLQFVRNYCRQEMATYLPKREAGLLAGIILGDKTDIGWEFYQEMISSGTVHIVVASGYNVLLVGGSILSLLFWFLRRKLAVLVAIFVMACYGLLAGAEPPVLRAVLMACLIFVQSCIGRKGDSLWFLVLTVWLMLIWEPSLVLSVSFQLSVAASTGLMVVAPWLINRYSLEWMEKLSLVSTVSTMLLSAPILWLVFGRISLIGLVSNVLVLPLVPPLMILGVGMLAASDFLYLPTYALAHLLVRIIEFFST